MSRSEGGQLESHFWSKYQELVEGFLQPPEGVQLGGDCSCAELRLFLLREGRDDRENVVNALIDRMKQTYHLWFSFEGGNPDSDPEFTLPIFFRFMDDLFSEIESQSSAKGFDHIKMIMTYKKLRSLHLPGVLASLKGQLGDKEFPVNEKWPVKIRIKKRGKKKRKNDMSFSESPFEVRATHTGRGLFVKGSVNLPEGAVKVLVPFGPLAKGAGAKRIFWVDQLRMLGGPEFSQYNNNMRYDDRARSTDAGGSYGMDADGSYGPAALINGAIPLPKCDNDFLKTRMFKQAFELKKDASIELRRSAINFVAPMQYDFLVEKGILYFAFKAEDISNRAGKEMFISYGAYDWFLTKAIRPQFWKEGGTKVDLFDGSWDQIPLNIFNCLLTFMEGASTEKFSKKAQYYAIRYYRGLWVKQKLLSCELSPIERELKPIIRELALGEKPVEQAFGRLKVVFKAYLPRGSMQEKPIDWPFQCVHNSLVACITEKGHYNSKDEMVSGSPPRGGESLASLFSALFLSNGQSSDHANYSPNPGTNR